MRARFVYRAAPADDFAPPLELEGLTALYHRPSGTTHLLAEPAPEILAVLDQEPADAGAVADRLAARFGFVVEGDAESVVAARLSELAALGLIRAS